VVDEQCRERPAQPRPGSISLVFTSVDRTLAAYHPDLRFQGFRQRDPCFPRARIRGARRHFPDAEQGENRSVSCTVGLGALMEMRASFVSLLMISQEFEEFASLGIPWSRDSALFSLEGVVRARQHPRLSRTCSDAKWCVA